jgi:Ankyrin repeats (3 copies)/Ankyrin repeat
MSVSEIGHVSEADRQSLTESDRLTDSHSDCVSLSVSKGSAHYHGPEADEWLHMQHESRQHFHPAADRLIEYAGNGDWQKLTDTLTCMESEPYTLTRDQAIWSGIHPTQCHTLGSGSGSGSGSGPDNESESESDSESVVQLQVVCKSRHDSVNRTNVRGETALMEAAFRGRVECCRRLIAAGADVNAVSTSWGNTCVSWAATAGRTDVVTLLLEMGAYVNGYSFTGNTPLHEAVFGEHRDTAYALAANGADLNAINENKETPLQTAKDTQQMYTRLYQGRQEFVRSRRTAFLLGLHHDVGSNSAIYRSFFHTRLGEMHLIRVLFETVDWVTDLASPSDVFANQVLNTHTAEHDANEDVEQMLEDAYGLTAWMDGLESDEADDDDKDDDGDADDDDADGSDGGDEDDDDDDDEEDEEGGAAGDDVGSATNEIDAHDVDADR